MRTGIMLRALHESGGVGVYTRYITEELLRRDPDNEYFLYHYGDALVGSFAEYPNAVELVVKGNSKFVWDQISIPRACRRDRIDVLFHPKFTVPLFSPCKTVMVLHGAGWFIPEHSKFWSSLDLQYLKMVMPMYCRRAAAILSVSQVTTDVFNERFGLPEGKIRTVYLAPGRHFQPVTNEETLTRVREKYALPPRFILTLSKYPGGERKNIGGIFAAFSELWSETEHRLVVVGRDCNRYLDEYDVPTNGYGEGILFPGYVAQDDLPAVYTLADLFLYPSNMEAFPIPITEAMACGTAIVTSDQNGLREIAGDAAIRVDASDSHAIAEAVRKILTDVQYRNELEQRARTMSARYSWDICAEKTLDVLRGVV